MKNKDILELETKLKLDNDFDTEIVPHMPALKSFALKMTNDIDDADDLLQDTMLKAYRFYGSFEKGTNAKAWLFQIMKNSFINNYRKNSKEPNKVDYEDVQNFYESVKSNEIQTQHFQRDAFNDVLDDQIVNALAQLPNEFRTIIFLSDIEEYTYEEIADFMDCPIGTVRSRLHRARKMLYSLLVDYAANRGIIRKQNKRQKKSASIGQSIFKKGTYQFSMS